MSAGKSAKKVTKFFFNCARATAMCAKNGTTVVDVVLADKAGAQITVQLTFRIAGKQLVPSGSRHRCFVRRRLRVAVVLEGSERAAAWQHVKPCCFIRDD